MVNRWRGEVALVIDGVERRMRLTLGALAELEEALGAEGLADLIGRFERGQVRSRDILAVLAAGLAGAGEGLGARELAAAEIEGGALAAARAAAALIARAFGVAEAAGAETGAADG
ncbi:MAG: gene transfer agent family protein [Alphaproteobacteria bacterium]|nr:MAG: gene transfer agent family protein [Alphaproteobacteria bacterium]